MKILITGAAGFIGINLSKRLLSAGHSVLGIDNFYSSSKEKLKTLYQFSNFTFLEKDITESWTPVKAELDNINAICNLACPASPPVYLKDSVYTTKTSVLGTLNALECATERNIPILHASTSEVYGDPLEHPQKETYYGNVNPIGIRACYDEGKRVAESLCFDFHRQHGTRIKVVRIFNTYGSFMERNDGRVITNFIDAALRNTPLTVYGDGSQTRSFCYVEDLVEGIIQFLFLQKPVTGPINLGNTSEISILELTEVIKTFFPAVTINYSTLMENDPKIRRPDIQLARELLEWSPRIPLAEGLQHTIEWFKDFYT